MSVHLVGGGWSHPMYATVYGPFVAEARQRAASQSRSSSDSEVAVLQLYDRADQDGVAKFEQFAGILRTLGVGSVRPLLVAEGDILPAGVLGAVDGLLVAGGPTPAYLTAVSRAADDIGALVAHGMPYLGFSAGAAIASSTAITGGWKCGDLVIAKEDCAEGLEQLTTQPGLGIVDHAVEAHAAQWGTLTRAIAAVARGDVERAVAIDEDTVCIVTGDTVQTAGAGQAWWVSRAPDGVTVQTTAGHDG